MNAVPKPTPKPKAPRKAPNRANLKRKALAFIRAYHSPERCAWVKSLPCIISGQVSEETENVHTVGGGAGRKADYTTIVPMNRYYHHRLHQMGVTSFEKCYEVSLEGHAFHTQSRWLATQAGTPNE